jgi:hypothetical protein
MSPRNATVSVETEIIDPEEIKKSKRRRSIKS